MDEALIGDWMPPSPSPKAFFSSFLSGDEQIDSGPMLQMPVEARNGNDSYESRRGMGFDEKNAKQGGNAFGNDMSYSQLPDHNQKMKSRGGLGERIAARAGFNAPSLNTESMRPADHTSTDEIRSPYLTIPPGISPTALLDSPVFFSNSLTQASPTTGKFSFFPTGNAGNSNLVSNAQSKDDFFDDVSDSFAFKPHAEPGLPYSVGSAHKMSQSMTSVRSVRSENTFPNMETSQIISQNVNGLRLNEGFSQPLTDRDCGERPSGSEIGVLDTISGGVEHSPPLSDQQDDEGDQRVSSDPMAGGSTGDLAEDGYNWRKYGQKNVKGSKYPRCYYKCTHLSCPVKKKVERSIEGHITEIIYKGAHNHSKPTLTRRSSLGSSNQLSDIEEQGGHENGSDRDSVWPAAQNGSFAGARDWRDDSLEENSMTTMNSELNKHSSSLPMQNNGAIQSGDAVDPFTTFSNDEEDDDRGTHGSVSLTTDVEGDESESKRRKIETYATEIGGGATRAIREPRVVVQTTSGVDILDDGYRWRKYGQKVVKGNPNPRSYYKCTSAGCSVRKHVERASHDLKSVITTYEGKHNHDVPAARNSSHVGSAASAALASQPQSLLTRSDPSQISNMARYERSPHLGSFNLPMMQPLGPPPDGFSMGMNQPGLQNLSMAGLGPGQNKFPGMPTHPYLMQQQQQQQQQHQMNDMGFMISKTEAKAEPNPDPNVFRSNGYSVYQQLMHRLPLGP